MRNAAIIIVLMMLAIIATTSHAQSDMWTEEFDNNNNQWNGTINNGYLWLQDNSKVSHNIPFNVSSYTYGCLEITYTPLEIGQLIVNVNGEKTSYTDEGILTTQKQYTCMELYSATDYIIEVQAKTGKFIVGNMKWFVPEIIQEESTPTPTSIEATGNISETNQILEGIRQYQHIQTLLTIGFGTLTIGALWISIIIARMKNK